MARLHSRIVSIEITHDVEGYIPVKRAGETVEGSGEGEEGIGQGGSDEFAGVGRDITTLVITVAGR